MDHRDRRAARRLLRSEEVSIQLLLPSLEATGPATVVSSATVDVSVTGLRILLPRAVAAERILDLCVVLRGSPKRFLLTGETRWCRYSAERGGYEVGIAIQEGEGTDHSAWSELLTAQEEDPKGS
jgi:hypothetical protein